MSGQENCDARVVERTLTERGSPINDWCTEFRVLKYSIVSS